MTVADKADGPNKMVMSLAMTAGSIVAAATARRVTRTTWKLITGKEPPVDPLARDTDVVVAVLWAVATGAAIGMARLLVERQIASRLNDRAAD